MPGLLDLPAPVIEQIAKVRLDERIDYYVLMSKERCPKHYCFWVLRDLGHRGVHAAAWGARHSVVKADLWNVAKLGDTEWCRVLLASGADVHERDDRALAAASANGHTATVKLLLASGAAVNSRNDGALRLASDYGHTATVKLLLDSGADVHARNEEALRMASYHGHTATVELLLERGADASMLD